MRTAMLLMPLTLIMLAGCGKPAEMPGWMKDEMEGAGLKKPAPPEPAKPAAPPPAPTGTAHWDGLEIHLLTITAGTHGKTLAAFGVLNKSGRAADWPPLSLASVEVMDLFGNSHPPDREANVEAFRAVADKLRVAARDGKAADLYWFSTPPRGCGPLLFTVRMPDGKTLRWAAPESMIERR